MTSNDFAALEFLARCSGWTEAPLDKSGKLDPRFRGVINYLLVMGYVEFHIWQKLDFYRITKSGRQALADRSF